MTDLQVLPEVSYSFDRHDEMELLERIQKLAADSAGAHVYEVFPGSRSHADRLHCVAGQSSWVAALNWLVRERRQAT